MNDATDRPVELGKVYGYSTTSNGWSVVVIGRAVKLKEEQSEI
jgi:hypothetical protein